MMSSVILLVSIIFVSCVNFSPVEGISEYHVDASSGMIIDSGGRERIFHGLNVVMKASPWHPTTDMFDPELSFADADIAMLRSWGLNVVRLGVMWPGVEPQRGQVNQTYLEIMQTIVRKLHAAGIVTLLEFHQDLLSSRFCGEGIPSWVLDSTHMISETNSKDVFLGSDDRLLPSGDGFSWWEFLRDAVLRFVPLSSMSLTGKSFVESFPEPLSGRWPLGPDSPGDHSQQQPSEEQCDKHPWAWYYFSFAVSRAFQSLYENTWGWADLFARYWQVVASTFRNQPGVLGYELINEPWAGDMYHNPLLLVPGVADHYNLAPFYEKLQLAIRDVDPDRILFMETVTFEDVRCGFSSVPGGAQFQNRTVLSYHYYQPPNFMPRQAIRERIRESKKLGCGAMLTEFFVADEAASESRSSSDSVDAVLAEADAHQQSWIGWEYKAFQNKTGSVVEQSMFTASGEVNLVLAKKLARTYPQAVMGSILSFSFDPISSDFSLSFVAGDADSSRGSGDGDLQSTQVFVHRSFYYPSGLAYSVNHDCIQMEETERLIILRHSQACVGLRIFFRISKKPFQSS
ncbi:hypothetical protein M758_4G087200 [Ceratodon purpureus]|nr:hypothetical protein M758_4G087200 [Ceratodon purpureus]